MSDNFVPSNINMLARAMAFEFDAHRRIFGIPTELFAPALMPSRLGVDYMGHFLDNPIGVAAGPHTQLAQNIVAAYLAGARFFELKTVQQNDRIKVAKPCIDMRDIGYNCEWSQELTLDQSFDQYLNAFVLIHGLARARDTKPDGFAFNMSVGYDLEGIRSAKVRRFLERMRDSGEDVASRAHKVREAFSGTPLTIDEFEVPSCMSNSVTLSTMHGCPPEEIEKIGLFLIEELGMHTTVKFNPTLLGKDKMEYLLKERLGFENIDVPQEAFEHDPSFDDAVAIVESLRIAAEKAKLHFAIKLTNTLETNNFEQILPATEKKHYLSGRALHPIAVTLAARFAERFKGAVSISLAGGVDAFNLSDVLSCGVRPVTVCSDLLRPGGYGRLAQYIERVGEYIESSSVENICDIPLSVKRLALYAERAASDPRYAREAHRPSFSSKRALSLVDCMAAPCQERCPAQQKVPDYLYFVASDREDEALEVILRDNPLACTTGFACHHPCTSVCTRNALDDPLAIRELKRYAAGAPMPNRPSIPNTSRELSIGIIGAGPAGLAAASFCRRLGLRVTVYEAQSSAGGIPASAIPSFRLPTEAFKTDIERVESMGVAFELGSILGENLKLNDLCQKHHYVFIATGAGRGRRLGVEGEREEGVYDGIEFLEQVKQGRVAELGTNVLVIGGGNAAIDAARTASRLVSATGKVSLIYRRTREEMPAASFEIEAAFKEGVRLEELFAPSRVLTGSAGRAKGLECLKMKLGTKDRTGRRRPVPIEGKKRVFPADAIIVAVGQGRIDPVIEQSGLNLKPNGRIEVDRNLKTNLPRVFAGGDATRGPSTIIEAIADGRAFADVVAHLERIKTEPKTKFNKEQGTNALLAKKSRRHYQEVGFPKVASSIRKEQAQAEAARCLNCDELCALCVTVCPNRAHVLYEIQPFRIQVPLLEVKEGHLVQREETAIVEITQRYQTAVIADYCNECGNCVTFCPTKGVPFKDKPRIYLNDKAERTKSGMVTVRLLEEDGTRKTSIQSEETKLIFDGAEILFETNEIKGQIAPDLTLRRIELIEKRATHQIIDPSEAIRLAAIGRAIGQSLGIGILEFYL